MRPRCGLRCKLNLPLDVPCDPGRHRRAGRVRHAHRSAKPALYGVASSPEPPYPLLGPALPVVAGDEPPDELACDIPPATPEAYAAGVCHDVSARAAGTPLLAPLAPAKPPKLSHAPLSSGASLDQISALARSAPRLRALRRRLFFPPLRGGLFPTLARARARHAARVKDLLRWGHLPNCSRNCAGPS